MRNPLKSEKRRVERYIFRAWKLDADGNRLWARDYGYRAWRIPIYAD